MLVPGGRLDLGRVWEVVELVDSEPRKLARLVECLWDEDPAVANRAADALERVTRERPARAQKWKEPLLGLLAEAGEKRLRWNLALLIPRLKLTVSECRRAAALLRSYLDDKSSILKTAALHGLADLTRQDFSLVSDVIDLLRLASRSGTPAMRARSRILLEKIEKPAKERRSGNSLHMFT
jgi:plasmid stabilization system protein ParE